MSGHIPEDYLNDLSSRFIINIPEEQRRDPIRLFFQIEQAYWYYLDFHRSENAKLRNCGIKEFSKNMIRHIPSCSQLFLKDFDEHYEQWRKYKLSVPTYGAILLNEDLTKVLLVQSFFERTSWGFPKGKINEDEAPVNCAVREVYEEIGCNISQLIKQNVYLESYVNDQLVRLYIIPGVKEDTKFSPQTRMEIKDIQWFGINALPINKKDTNVKTQGFFMVMPFMRKLKAWVDKNKNRESPGKKRRHKSIGDPTVLGNAPVTIPHEKFIGSPKNSNNGFSKQLKKQPVSDNGRVRSTYSSEKFIVPCWLTFKLNYGPILKCFD